MLQPSNSAKRSSKDRVQGSFADTRSLGPGDTMRREKKSAVLTIRFRPSVRAMAEKRAREQDRSLASYIGAIDRCRCQGLRRRQAKKGVHRLARVSIQVFLCP